MPDIVQTLLAEYGLLIILAAIALEGLGIPTPGQSLLVAGALLSAHGEFDIRLFLVLTWVAALAGSMLGYLAGRLGGRKLLLRLPLNPSRIERMETFCQRYGALLVIASRFIDGPRQLTGIFVGSLKMPVMAFFLAISTTKCTRSLWMHRCYVDTKTVHQLTAKIGCRQQCAGSHQ